MQYLIQTRWQSGKPWLVLTLYFWAVTIAGMARWEAMIVPETAGAFCRRTVNGEYECSEFAIELEHLD